MSYRAPVLRAAVCLVVGVSYGFGLADLMQGNGAVALVEFSTAGLLGFSALALVKYGRL